MSFGYNRNDRHQHGESFWTSNSDLFLGLSSIFLILYVVASLRSGADGVNNATENKKLKIEIQDLQNQLKTYESIKEQYMQKQASKDEIDEYNELMDKLTLLQEEAKDEKNRLTNEARENAKKELALNKYQQMVRNIINSNSLSKVKITNRNEVIDDQHDEILVQKGKIGKLNKDISQKESLIRSKEQQIDQVSNQLKENIEKLKKSYKREKLTQSAYQSRLKKLKSEAENQMAALERQKMGVLGELQSAKNSLKQTESQLNKTQSQLSSTQNQLNNTQGALTQSRVELEKKGQEISTLNSRMVASAQETKAKMAALNAQYENARAQERAAFEGELRKQKNLSNAEIARREAAFKADADAKAKKLQAEMGALAGQLKSTEGQLAAANAELAARKSIAHEIKKGFDKLGIKADIDPNSGDVLLDFGQSYFESNSANLTVDMKSVLKKAMPVYSKSLFGNNTVSRKISSVEVIGFASPTYKSKIIDPYSTKPEDRAGLKYNMDLSYKRAKAIFNYILDNDEMDFKHRDELVPNLKVSGRSFLDLMKRDRSIASVEDYCKKNDCKKSQRVIIRFSMDNNK